MISNSVFKAKTNKHTEWKIQHLAGPNVIRGMPNCSLSVEKHWRYIVVEINNNWPTCMSLSLSFPEAFQSVTVPCGPVQRTPSPAGWPHPPPSCLHVSRIYHRLSRPPLSPTDWLTWHDLQVSRWTCAVCTDTTRSWMFVSCLIQSICNK